MEIAWFDASKYISSVQNQIKNKLSSCDKLYLEVSGDLIDQWWISKILPAFQSDTYRTIFSEFKYDLDVFLCVKAQDIIENKSFMWDNRSFRECMEIYLKKIENKFWSKPHIVINLIDIERMYDKIFSFEQHFQKLGYRVREKYKIKAYTYDIKQVISEDWFGNDDHIPTSKKLILIAGLTPESWKLATAIAQIYLDQEIDIKADYAKLEVLPNYSLPKDDPLNVLAREEYMKEVEGLEFDSSLEVKDLYDRWLEKHAFIQKVFGLLKKPLPSKTEDYLIWQVSNLSIK